VEDIDDREVNVEKMKMIESIQEDSLGSGLKHRLDVQRLGRINPEL